MTTAGADGSTPAGGLSGGGGRVGAVPGGGLVIGDLSGGGLVVGDLSGGGGRTGAVPGGLVAGDRAAGSGEGGARGPRGDHPGQPGGAPRSLATRQAELVEALTAGRPVPSGFDGFRVEAARVALLRKRAGEVSRQWPMLAAGFGERWKREFAAWAAARPTQGSLRDGWDLARDLLSRDALPAIAAAELAEREATWRYDGASAPAPRRGPAVRSAAGAIVIQIAGRARVIRRP